MDVGRLTAYADTRCNHFSLQHAAHIYSIGSSPSTLFLWERFLQPRRCESPLARMAAPRYSYVPPMDSQISTSYPPPPPPQDEKKQFSADVEECGPLPPSNGLLMSATPSSKAGRATFWLRSIVHKYWILEAAASIFSLLIFAIIIGMLAWYDNTYYGDASTASPNKRPTLFPVLAILGAVMRASMLLPVATAIGQLKWGWFRAGRRLLDIERFDEAARGILGSARLIWTLRFR